MNKMMIKTAILAAGLGLGALAADAATTNVNVVNTGANPVPVVGTVEVLATPPVRAGVWRPTCQLVAGATNCVSAYPLTAPDGTVFRVTGITGTASSSCIKAPMYAYLMGSLSGSGSTHAYVLGDQVPGTPTTVFGPESTELYFTTLEKLYFYMGVPAASCPYPAYGALNVNYVIEPKL